MSVRVITVPYDPAARRFDDDALVAHLDGLRLVSLADHAFVIDGVPTLALVVRTEPQRPQRAPDRKEEARPQDALSPQSRVLFEALRSWRNARAKRDGRPAYVLFTNAQLGTIAAVRPTTRAELHAIEGIGDARVRDYADAVLQLVAASPEGATDAGEGA